MKSTDPERSKQAVERTRAAKGLGPEGRPAMRQEHAVPLLEELRAWLAATEAQVLPKSPRCAPRSTTRRRSGPQVDFRDVLLRIATESDPGKLVPHGWRAQFAEAVGAEHQAAIARLFGS
jgi:integrase